MKWGPIVAFVAGVAVLAGLTIYAGAGGVFHAFAELGLVGLATIALLHLPVVGLLGWAWWTIGRDLPGAEWRKFFWARLVRDAAAETLPFSQLGGFVLGVRTLQLGRVAAIGGAFSMSVDLVMELWAKLFYFILGLLALLALAKGLRLSGTLMLVFGISAVLFAIPYVLRGRLRRLLESSALALARRWPSLGSHEDATSFFDRIFADPKRLIKGFCAHSLGWVLGAGEAWVVFHFMGMHITVLEALAIDSLAMGLRTFAFLVPAAAGVQEGTYVAVCALFGISPASAIAVSLARRARDFTIGIPVLAIWQFSETQAQVGRVERRAH